MKKLICGFAVLALLTAGCSKDAYDDSIMQSKQNQNLGVKKVSIDEVPFLQPTVDQFMQRGAASRGIEDLQLDLTKILEYSEANGYKSYSISIIGNDFSDKEDYFFETLNIIKNEEEYKAFITKYNQEDDSKPFSMLTFTGTIEISNIENTLKKIEEFENGNKDAEPAPPTPPNPDEGTGGGGGSADPTTFSGSLWNFILDLVGVGHTDINGFHINDVWGDMCYCNVGSYTGYTLVITPTNMGNIPNVGNPPSEGGSGTGIVTIANPSWPSPEEASQKVKANLLVQLLGLDGDAQIWLKKQENLGTTAALFMYMSEEGTESIPARRFATEAYNTIRAGGSVNFPNEIIIDPTFKNNQKADCVLQKLLNQNMGNNFKNILLETFGSSDRANIKFMVRNLPATANGTFDAVTIGSSPYITQNKSMFYVILDANFVNNASTIEIAMTLMHELIHAELIQRCLELGIITQMTFNTNFDGVLIFKEGPIYSFDQQAQMLGMIIQRYKTYADASQWNHNLMTDQAYNTAIAENTADIYPLLNDPNNDFLSNINSDPSNPYGTFTLERAMEFLAWAGLEGTNGYTTSVTNNPPNLSGVNYINGYLSPTGFVPGAAQTKFTHTCQ